MTLRKPCAAGRFYSGTKEELEKNLSALVGKNIEKENSLGAVSPHAGYTYSGLVAGKTLSRIKFKESCIILGPNHTGIGRPFSIISAGKWRTPLGDAPIDTRLARAILKGSVHIEEDASAHEYEHSIEVQLPFLQFIKSGLKFVPIVISQDNLRTLKEVGKEIAECLKEDKAESVIIASSDMTHYESHKAAEEKDGKAIDAILRLDADGLMDEILNRKITMCGFAPTIVMLSASKALGATGAELVDYKTSGDITGDYSSVVGYAGILIKR